MDLRQVRSDWTELGASDPLWAVLVSPEHRHGRWDTDAFFATGAAEVRATMARAASLGLHPGRARALDFGCGAGRLTAALTEYADQVVGVDISPTMLAKARDLDATGRVEFVENDRADLSVFADASFDLVYSSLVLQHLPTPLALGYLAEMIRVLAPGGLLIVQVAGHPDRSARGWITRFAPSPVLRFAQRRLLGYPAPMDMHGIERADVDRVCAEHAAGVADEVQEPMYGGHWSYSRFYITGD